jgi:hypothetical protein
MFRVTRMISIGCALFLAATPLRAQRRPITVVEIEKAGARITTAYDAVSTLRPRWLEAPSEVLQLQRGNARASVLHVYVDDHDLGTVDYLKTIPVERVGEIRWYSTNEAGSHFGPSEGPVIAVTLRR